MLPDFDHYPIMVRENFYYYTITYSLFCCQSANYNKKQNVPLLKKAIFAYLTNIILNKQYTHDTITVTKRKEYFTWM